MKLLIGLGNPGQKYQSTRHNLGANIIQHLASLHHLSLGSTQTKLLSQIAELPCTDALRDVSTPDNKILIAIPNTYMNESGIAVQKIISYYKIDPQDLYIIHDDLDLKVGKWKLQFDRSAAGHNGIKSIIEHLGTQAFNRLRVGIGHPSRGEAAFDAVEDYVLLPFLPAEKVIINQTIVTITKEIQKICNS